MPTMIGLVESSGLQLQRTLVCANTSRVWEKHYCARWSICVQHKAGHFNVFFKSPVYKCARASVQDQLTTTLQLEFFQHILHYTAETESSEAHGSESDPLVQPQALTR